MERLRRRPPWQAEEAELERRRSSVGSDAGLTQLLSSPKRGRKRPREPEAAGSGDPARADRGRKRPRAGGGSPPAAGDVGGAAGPARAGREAEGPGRAQKPKKRKVLKVPKRKSSSRGPSRSCPRASKDTSAAAAKFEALVSALWRACDEKALLPAAPGSDPAMTHLGFRYPVLDVWPQLRGPT